MPDANPHLLRALIADGHTDRQLARWFGVHPDTAATWRRKLRRPRPRNPEPAHAPQTPQKPRAQPHTPDTPQSPLTPKPRALPADAREIARHLERTWTR